MIANWAPWMDVVFVLALAAAAWGVYALIQLVRMWCADRDLNQRIARRYRRHS